MPDYEYIQVERDGPLGVVTLNRPQALNALFAPLVREMVEALEGFDADPEIRALVPTRGPRGFAAGADLKEMSSQSAVDALLNNRIAYWDRVRNIAKPIIAAVSGYALGGGCELAMLCDIILASETARFGQPEINVGLIPGAGGTQRLTRTVGKYKAMEMVLTGAMIDAYEAVTKAFESTIEAGIELERRSFYFLFASEYSHEGFQAFIEKRKPEYKG